MRMGYIFLYPAFSRWNARMALKKLLDIENQVNKATFNFPHPNPLSQRERAFDVALSLNRSILDSVTDFLVSLNEQSDYSALPLTAAFIIFLYRHTLWLISWLHYWPSLTTHCVILIGNRGRKPEIGESNLL